jgi:hypothetical protein
LSAGSYMLWRSISHTVNLVLRLQQADYHIRCSWSVLDHHAADKENEADLARSWHWFLHLGKDIWLIFCSSLSDTCSCQSLWQGRHGNWMTLKHIRLCWYLLAYTSQFEFMVADEFSTCQQWLLSHILWQMFHQVLKNKEFTLCTMMIISQNVGPNENYIGL